MNANVAVVNFVDEDYEGQVGELVNPFFVDDTGTVHIEKESGGPITLITQGEGGEFILIEVPKNRIMAVNIGWL